MEFARLIPRVLGGAPPAFLLCGYRDATELIECERVESV
jgi:hypothetical protein